MKTRLVLIGPGRVGTAVASRLHRCGYPLVAVIGRDPQRTSDAAEFLGCPAAATIDLGRAAAGDTLLLAVPDDQLAGLVQRLYQRIEFNRQTTLIHFSGLHPASIMRPAPAEHACLSIHPLLPFADRKTAIERLSGCPCAIEGDEARLPLAEELVRAFAGHPFRLPSEEKVRYHAAASIASNFFVTLTALARDLLVECGFQPEEGLALLGPLLQATSENLLLLGPEQALTGPVVRGDRGTVERHLEVLGSGNPERLEIYRSLAQQTLRLAITSGRLAPAAAAELLDLLEQTEEISNSQPHIT